MLLGVLKKRFNGLLLCSWAAEENQRRVKVQGGYTDENLRAVRTRSRAMARQGVIKCRRGSRNFPKPVPKLSISIRRDEDIVRLRVEQTSALAPIDCKEQITKRRHRAHWKAHNGKQLQILLQGRLRCHEHTWACTATFCPPLPADGHNTSSAPPAAAAYQSSGKSKSQQMRIATRPKSVSKTGTPRLPGRILQVAEQGQGGTLSKRPS
eukprot:SAG31_NODE_2918_length_4914_cov_3.620145_4_plen_209_part_00